MEELIAELADSLLARVTDERVGLALAVNDVSLSLPVESRMSAVGEIEMSLPRGVLATGFDWPLSRLQARLVAAESSPADEAADGVQKGVEHAGIAGEGATYASVADDYAGRADVVGEGER